MASARSFASGNALRSATFWSSAAEAATTAAAADPLAGAGCAEASSPRRRPNLDSGIADLQLPPGDELLQRLVDARVDAGVGILREHLLPALRGDDVGWARSESLPAVEVLGRRDPRTIETGAVVPHRVLGPQEVTARADLAQRVHRQPLVVDRHAVPEDPLEHAQLLDVDDEFLVGREQGALEPTRRVEDEVDAAEDRRPHAHHRLVRRLRVGRF